MAQADPQKAKGHIWWRSARTFGQESNPTTWRLARMNGVPPVGNARVQHFIHHLSPVGVAGFVMANDSMSALTSS
jgi:type I restriction-modification system DNA methylase subunit